jgi:hypothetical protein
MSVESTAFPLGDERLFFFSPSYEEYRPGLAAGLLEIGHFCGLKPAPTGHALH